LASVACTCGSNNTGARGAVVAVVVKDACGVIGEF
jgi:hypothetical protein